MIVLSTLNAKYIHASLGLRYLLANMAPHGGEGMREISVLREFTLSRSARDIVSELLATLGPAGAQPQIVGFGVYIWNVRQTTDVVHLLKKARPGIVVVLGGPEVSHELEQQEIVQLADHVVTGWGDLSFPKLCRELMDGVRPLPKVIAGEQPALDQIASPYAEYTDADLAHRVLYVEASRGCPFKCEFCLSALDKSAWAFDLDAFLLAMERLYDRGARNFKFVDRTFNLKIEASVRILQFFLDRLTSAQFGSELFIHFEVIPDHLPDRLRAMIVLFPPGVLQFEIGIQSFNVAVQQRVSRRQDNAKTLKHLSWLLTHSNAHLHTDLIFGLPGENLASFAEGFDRLYALKPHEIQLGILKRLRGTPIARHTVEHRMMYDPEPPYTVRETAVVDTATMQRFTRFSRYWDLVANSGRFKQGLTLLLDAPGGIHKAAEAKSVDQDSPFHAFANFADWLWTRYEKTRHTTSGITPETLVDALFIYLSVERGLEENVVRNALLADYLSSGARASPECLRGHLSGRTNSGVAKPQLARRQRQHGNA